MSATVGIVSPGLMGRAIGRALQSGGTRVVVTASGRSERTARLAADSGLEQLPDLEAVVVESTLLLSVVPPGEARRATAAIAAAVGTTGTRPLVVDLNAVSPGTVALLAQDLAEAGLEFVDGSISGPPPAGDPPTRIYLSGDRAAEVAAILSVPAIAPRVVPGPPGLASAVKMSTASVYKGRVALLFQALLAAHRYGVLEPVLDDLASAFPGIREQGGRTLALGAAKSGRYVDEMHEIAVTQEAAGLTPALFLAVAEVYRSIAASPLAALSPEEVSEAIDLPAFLASLGPAE